MMNEELSLEIKEYGSVRRILINPNVLDKLKKEPDNGLMEWFPDGEWTFNKVPIIEDAKVSKWVLDLGKGRITMY